MVALVALCKQFNPKIEEIGSLAEKLTPFAVVFRYPDVDIYPKKQVVLNAIRDAEKIIDTVKKLIKF